MKHTNNSIFTRVVALMLGLFMLAGAMTSCFGAAGNDSVGATPNTPSVPNHPSTDDEEGNLLYKDPGADGTQSSFLLDTVTVTLN